MGAIKSGSDIVVQGTGNTLASVKTDIADPTFFDELTPGNYRVVGNRDLIIDPLADLTIGNASDFSVTEGLQLTPTSGSANSRIDTTSTSHFKMYGNTYLKLGIDGPTAQPTGVMLITGACTILGDATYRPLISDGTEVVFRNIRTADFSLDIWNVQHVDFENFRYHTFRTILMDGTDRFNPNGHTFEDIVIDSLTTLTPPITDYGTQDGIDFVLDAEGTLDFVTMKDITIKHCRRGINPSDACPAIENGVFIENRLGALICQGDSNMSHLYKSDVQYSQSGFYTGIVGQRFTYINGGSSSNNASWSHNLTYSTLLLRDYNSTDQFFGLSRQYGRFLLWNVDWTGGGWEKINCQIIYVYGLTLVVQDEDGNPVENAVVHIYQEPDEREHWTFYTDSAGKPITMRAMNGVVVLGNKAYISGAFGSETFELWSDGVAGRQHKVEVFKDGVGGAESTVVMDQDRSLTLTLERVIPPTPQTVLARVIRSNSTWRR